MLGIIYAVASSLLFGLYYVVRKYSSIAPLPFTTLIAVSFFVFSGILYLMQSALGNQEAINDPRLLLAVVTGVLWTGSMVVIMKSIDSIGVTRANQWKNIQGPVGVILALFVLNESKSVSVLLVVLAGLAIFGSAWFFNINTSRNETRQNLSGVLLALLAGLGLGLVSLTTKYLADANLVYSLQVIWGFTAAIALVAFQIFTKQWNWQSFKNKKEIILGFGAGMLSFGGNLCMLLAFSNTEASIAFPIIQFNFIVVVFFGLFVFKEIPIKKNRIRLLTGTGLAIVGILLLNASRS